MKKPIGRFSKPKTDVSCEWHNGSAADIHLYARALQKAARSLLQTLEPERSPATAWDVCPILWLYRQSLELHLKALVGEGSNFLKSKTDGISLYQTHSVRWLARLVCQVIKAVGWESEFVCEGFSNLAGFTSLVDEIESLDPVARATSFANSQDRGWASRTFQNLDGAQLAAKLDALLELLDVTTDALAATWDQHSEQAPEGGGDFGLTIQ